MNSHSRADSLHPEAQKGIALYDQGRFHEAHEHLELAWMATPSPERDLYQGILQIGLAYYQISRENYRGALKMLKRGQRNLQPLADSLLGIDVAALREQAKTLEQALRVLGPGNLKKLDPDLISTLPRRG